MASMKQLLGREPALIGVTHVLPLPGSPGWGGDMGPVVERAVADAEAYERGGFDALIIENYCDVPFARDFAGRGAVAGLAAVAARIADRVDLPLGINVLRNDALSAVAIAATVGARFIRVNVHTGAAVTDQGIVQSEARETLRSIRESAPDLVVFADVFVKHAAPLGNTTLEREALDAVQRGGAAALIVTGEGTGSPASLDDVRRVRAVLPETPVLVGSGVTVDTIPGILRVASGIIIGSAVMVGGEAARPVDPERVAAILRAAGR